VRRAHVNYTKEDQVAALARHSKLSGAALALVLLAITIPSLASPEASAQAEGRYYPQTGKTLAPEFIQFYDRYGGLPIFGFPLTNPEVEGGFKVQYLERARIEYHPENAGTGYDVQLGLLGSIQTAGRRFASATPEAASNAPGRVYFPETGHSLSGKFLEYWQRNGGLALFGYPISEPLTEGSVTAQYFQRNRFEHHPESAGTSYEVQLGLLGRDMLAQRVKVTETTVSLPTYGYEQGFTTPEGNPVAPYPRLDTARMGPPSMRPYRLIVLENRYIKLSVLPQLAGRLYEVVYKPTGHNELYSNPVVKPAPFSAKGWWLGVGGMEWAAPTEEHGLMEYLPWDAAVTRDGDGGATVTVTAVDRMTGLRVSGAITLSPEEAAYTVSARMENRTGAQQRGQLWTNAMVAPGGTNKVSPRLRFVMPTAEMVVHSTNDPGLPAAHNTVTWPQYGGRDLADMSTWQGWLGGFAMPSSSRGSFAAVFNPDADEGLVKTFSNREMPGLKFFGWGSSLNPAVYTDGDSSYAELWGGITPTFWDYATFPPGSGLGWTERWQPVARTGGVSLAGAWGTASVAGSTVRLLPVRRIEGATLAVTHPDGSREASTFNAYPDRPATVTLSAPAVDLEVRGADGTVLLKGTPVR
jgi:hypothetical protein